MNAKPIFQSLILCTLIALTASVAQAQTMPMRGTNPIANPTPPVIPTTPAASAVVETNRAAETQAARRMDEGDILDRLERPKKAIVGSWLLDLDCGCKILASFTSDGIYLSSGQNDISLPPSPFPTGTAQHGVWEALGNRQFAVTLLVIYYDVPTGEYRGLGKVRNTFTVNEAGDHLSGSYKFDVFDPGNNLVATFSGTLQGTRIKVEPLN